MLASVDVLVLTIISVTGPSMLVLISLGRCKKCVERLFDIFVTEDVRSVIDVPVLEVESIIFVSDLVMSDVDATTFVIVELMVSNFKIAFDDFSSADFTKIVRFGRYCEVRAL